MDVEITDMQRRDVAHKLRALDMSDIDVDGCIIDSTKYVGLLLMRMLDVSCDYRDGLHYFPGHFSAQAVVELFADLIDRPTCSICATDHEYEDSVRCDRCRMTFRRPWEPFKYCPNCGAEVVRTSD